MCTILTVQKSCMWFMKHGLTISVIKYEQNFLHINYIRTEKHDGFRKQCKINFSNIWLQKFGMKHMKGFRVHILKCVIVCTQNYFNCILLDKSINISITTWSFHSLHARPRTRLLVHSTFIRTASLWHLSGDTPHCWKKVLHVMHT